METAAAKGKTEISRQPSQVERLKEIPRLITENINVEPVISWKENRWIFEKQSLSQIAIGIGA